MRQDEKLMRLLNDDEDVKLRSSLSNFGYDRRFTGPSEGLTLTEFGEVDLFFSFCRLAIGLRAGAGERGVGGAAEKILKIVFFNLKLNFKNIVRIYTPFAKILTNRPPPAPRLPTPVNTYIYRAAAKY